MKILQKFALIALSVIVLILTFYINFTSQIKDFENTAKSKEAVVNEYVNISSNFIELMTIYGNNYLENGQDEESELYSLFQEDSDSYNLDTLSGTKYETSSGNLTGIGSVPQSGTVKNEVNLALQYNEFFSSFYDQLPDVTWIYYTSENNFINLYPWVSSEDFAFSEEIKDLPFYSYATPENNSLRQAIWSPVYLDEAGQGLMVTLSSPIYKDDAFVGVISLDLTTGRLRELIDSDYQSYLVDTDNSVVAANVEFDPKEAVFNQVLGISDSDTQKIREVPIYSTQIIGSNYVYSIGFENTSWELFMVVPVWAIIGTAMLYTLPILLICILLFVTFAESEKRKRTEIKLTNSLTEIKSYHDLLENAARYDFLTKTCNRRGLTENFQELILQKDTEKAPITFIMGDIDEFKQFNDTFGHTAGDRVLIEIAKLMKGTVQARDIVCRWGGEEFIIILFGRKYEDGLRIAEALRKKIEANVIPWTESIELRATMTFGVAEHVYGDSMQSTITKTDRALYFGKEDGRNKVVGYQNCVANGKCGE